MLTLARLIFNFIRTNVLLIAKIIALFSGFYLITQYQAYEVKLGYLRNWLPTSLVQFFDIGFGSIGTFILLVPCSIIVLSFLIEDNTKLKVLSGFFGVFGSLFNLVRAYYNTTLGEIYNLGLFLVRHVATLEKKRQWFTFEFHRYAEELCANVDEKLNYFKLHLTEHDFVTYDIKLASLNTLQEVKSYALDIVNNLNADFDALPKKQTFIQKIFVTTWDVVSSKPFIGTVAVIGACVLIYFLAKSADTPKGLLTEVASVNKQTASAGEATAKIMSSGFSDLTVQQQNFDNLTHAVKQHTAAIAVAQDEFRKVNDELGSIKALLALNQTAVRTAHNKLVKNVNRVWEFLNEKFPPTEV